MSCVIRPEMKHVPNGASRRVREDMYLEYIEELVRLNPQRYLPIGQRKRWWNLRLEHPRTSFSRESDS
jgi:hypothetical protein